MHEMEKKDLEEEIKALMRDRDADSPNNSNSKSKSGSVNKVQAKVRKVVHTKKGK